MEFRGYLDHIRNDGDLIAAMAPRGLALPVPVCPPWDVREVVAHMATVYDHKVMAMRLGRRPEQGEWTTDEPYGKDTVEWFSDEHAKLLAELVSHAPKDFAWSWWEPDQTVGFWYRRMALETVVHRVDVETQFGAPSAIDPALAVDGIDEVLTIMLAGDEEASASVPGTGTVELLAGDDAWSVVLENSRTMVAPGRRTSPNAVLSGDPVALFLYLWGRVPIDAVTRRGDESRIALLRSRLAAATQ
ncbi:MAG: maleylpyruvate isomerase family mycothiol-dependent enzyme [Candidatus Dormiibacterota bacterium]